MIIVTNNPMVKERCENIGEMTFVNGEYGDVLTEVKNQIIDRHVRLLSHPLSGSVKPNETYYKTIFVSDSNFQYIDIESLEYIESAIEVYKKFIRSKQRPNWCVSVLNDFAFVDFYIAQSTLDRMGVLR